MQRLRTNQFLAYALMLTLVGSVLSLVLPTFQPSYATHKNITVEVDNDIDETYGQGDDVTISGSVEDIDEDEDQATIKIRKPSGSIDKTENVDLNSHGNFDMVYRLASNAADGIYSIEVDYSGEKVYTFFIVDEEDDTITVETDDETYNGGDDITISGQVDDVDDSEDSIEITITDPTDDDILDSKVVELDGDEFEYEFRGLDDDADHGRYAVKVTYDFDDQEGFTLFEVEDSGSDSSDNISAELSDDKYAPGDSVALSGNIDTKHSGTDLEIVVKDSANHIIESDSDVAVATNGDFDFDFDLDDDADEGEYTVTITYGSDDLRLTFDVDEDAGSSTTSKLTVKLNKASYLAGETMTVTGTVPRVVQDEDVNILIYDKNSIFVGSAAYVKPESDKTYSATLKLKSDLKVDEGYQVKVDYDNSEVKSIFSITGQISASDILTVKTDKTKYELGSTVRITGSVAAGSMVQGMKVLLQVYNPDQAAYRIDPVEVASDGSFSYLMPVGGPLGVPGTYEVKATYNGKQVKTTFMLGSSLFGLNVAGKTYQIQYDISAGSIKGMFVQENNKKLVIAIDATEDGQLKLMLPREVIDARTGSDGKSGEDAKFLVAAEDSSGPNDDVEIAESSTNGNIRTVVVDYKAGTDRIEISGTSVVPEFGALSAIVLAMAIVGIIVATARFSNKFSFIRQ